jgi:hypothetical protein
MNINFPLGRTIVTPDAYAHVDHADILSAVARHASGDWGDVDAEGWAANDHALNAGLFIASTYRDSQGAKFWIITEADRSVTSVLLEEDYSGLRQLLLLGGCPGLTQLRLTAH